jgi:hypothetical protein
LDLFMCPVIFYASLAPYLPHDLDVLPALLSPQRSLDAQHPTSRRSVRLFTATA